MNSNVHLSGHCYERMCVDESKPELNMVFQVNITILHSLTNY